MGRSLGVAVALAVQLGLAVEAPAAMDAAQRRAALEKLQIVGNVLYVGAHPDDENTAMLAWLSKGRKVEAAYLSLTRGSGGQNLIGTEQGPALGLLRTQELLAARAVDGAEQFFTRALDFGYSKTPEETLTIWDRDAVLSDMVAIIRSFRPDVIITRFPPDGSGGHGHHTASAILAREAFEAAGDPARFPEQLARVEPWHATRLLWNSWRRPEGAPPPALEVDLGAFDPLLGRSFSELAAEARSMHKSQGFGTAPRFGSLPNALRLVAGKPASSDLLDGVDTSWNRLEGGAAVARILERALASLDDEHPGRIVRTLLDADEAMAALPSDRRVERKRRELADLVAACAGLVLEGTSAVELTSPGQRLDVSFTVVNRSALPFRLERVELPFAAEALVPGQALTEGVPVVVRTEVAVPSGAQTTAPYWLREDPEKGSYRIADPADVGLPRLPSPFSATFVLSLDGRTLRVPVNIRYRRTDPVSGEVTLPVEIVPPASVTLEGPVLIFGDTSPRHVRAVVHATTAPFEGQLRLTAPDGWTVSPAAAEVAVPLGEERGVSFTVSAPQVASTGFLEAHVGPVPARTLVRVAYPHIEPAILLPRAESRLVRMPLAVPAGEIGYVMGAGDEIPAVLRQLGLRVRLLSDEDLERADLSPFATIVTGVRAFNTRPALAASLGRLLSWVEAGGTLVEQYNTTQSLDTTRIGPYPLEVSHDRVTVEEAPVTILAPADEILEYPNRIGPADFDGWVQERGLYFPHTWDTRYTPLLGMADPGEAQLDGSLLVAHPGKGTFIYTGLSFFRQLPAGVPGAIRLFVNLLAGGHGA